MRWLFWSSTSDNDRGNSSPPVTKSNQPQHGRFSSSSSNSSDSPSSDKSTNGTLPPSSQPPHSPPRPTCPNNDHSDSKSSRSWLLIKQYGNSMISAEHGALVSAVLAIGGMSLVGSIYRQYLRRIPNVKHIPPEAFRRRRLLGRVTRVGDGDNFHVYHTPGGRLAGWGWLRKVPQVKKELKNRTVHVRLAGVDAPELSHFGRPAQAFSREAHEWLSRYLLHRYVRVNIYKEDQYKRVVGTVHVRRWPFFWRDVSLRMLREGMATIYEAKSGVEFGGARLEGKYRKAEARAKRRRTGLWKNQRTWWGKEEKDYESPRDYKTRMAEKESGAGKESEKENSNRR